MAVKAKKTGGVNQGLIVLFGGIILLGAVLIYLFILRGVYGKFSTAELLPDTKVVKDIFYGEKPKVAILYSRYTENMLPEGSTWIADNISSWKKLLSSAGYSYDIIADSSIELGLASKYKVIILPGSKSMSSKEIMQIKEYLNKGGSIFATSGTASFTDDGKWRGWEFISQIFGINFSKEISRDEITKIHTLRGGLPLTANIPAGFPLRVATWDRPMSVEVLDPRTTQVSFWYNYRLQSGLSRDAIKKSAGIVYGTYGKGRFVWMGFDINSVIGIQQEDYIYMEALFNNSLNWLSRLPIAIVKDWPSNYDAAAVVIPVLSKDPGNIKNILPILNAEKIPATFFVRPSLAQNDKSLVRPLARYGEVGAQVDIGYLASVNDTVNKLNDYDTQLDKLTSAKNILQTTEGQSIVGVMPYYGIYDQNTVLSSIKGKYKYIFTDSLTDRSVPKTIVKGDSLVVSISKTGRDDYEVIRDYGLTEPDFQFYTYQEDIDRILFEGGLYTFKFHTGYQCTPANAGVVKKVIDDLKKKGYWITTLSQVENWWARRNYVEVRVTQRGDTRIALTVSNPGKKVVNNLVLEVEMSEPAKNITLSTEIIGTTPAKYEYNKEKRTIYVYINNLKASESRTYYFDYYIPNV